uniref:Uncharacterized protein n=1 Tax=Globisporangium ultimum (strain ATCC 200006 / CBS 805.95 / DAOM BR144) TaxID=431595 RepID=K3X2I8_GLOUD
MAFGSDDDGHEIPVRHRKKRSRPQSHLQQVESMDDRRRVHFALRGSALDQFQSWIKNSDAEPPPVRGAGAAKQIPDSELLMFKDSRIIQDAKTPPIFPADENNEIHKRVMQQLSPQQHLRRPRSWELSSPPYKKSSIRRSMGTLLREQLNTAAEDGMRHTLPLLARPSQRQTVRKDKAVMLQLLAECKAKAEGVVTSPVPPNQPGSSRNQRSRGGGNELFRNGSDPVMAIPDSVFFATNSFSPLGKIDLSDWTCFCTDANPAIFSHIGSKLSSRCVELNLSGLTALTTPRGFQALLQNCGKLKRLVLSECENIQTAGFCAIAQSCPLIESLDLSESESVTDNVLHCVLSSFQNLTRVKLNGCQRITDAGVLLFSAKKHEIHALEGLYLDRCHLVSNVSLLPLLKAHGATLQVFSIRGCRRVSDTVIKELFINQPKKLQELNISDCTSLTDACMEYLSTVPSYFGDRVATAYHHLVQIDVSGCMAFTSLACCWIAASAPFLQRIKAARCTGFCDKAALALASLAHLEEIDFTGCSQILESGMERMFLSDGHTKPGSSVTAKQRVVDSVVKKIKKLMMADCPNQGEPCVLAIINSCSKTLVELNLSNIAPLPAKTLIKLVKHCRTVTDLYVQRQPAVTRSVLAHLTSCNKHLRVLDLRHCVNVDDLAIYPLLVMQSLEELYLSGCRSITNRGLQSLPVSLIYLDLQHCRSHEFSDEGCRTIANRLSKLEKLDISHCDGVTANGISEIIQKCEFLYHLNVFQCPNITSVQLNRLLHDLRMNKYALDLISDPEMAFQGISSDNVDAAVKARRREKLLAEETRRQRAASSIQIHFTSRSRLRRERKLRDDCEWEEFCCAVDIQRVFRGYRCRKTYVFVRPQVTKAVVYIQYLWRKKLVERRVRKAMGYWTNRVVLKMFLLWKQHHLEIRMENERQKAAFHAAKALNFWGDKTLGRVFCSWRDCVRNRTIRAKKAIGFWKCQSMPRVLEAWRMYKDNEKLRRLRLTHVFLNAVDLEAHNSSIQLDKSKRANAVVKRLIWRLWREFVVDQKRFLLKATLSIVCGSLSAWAFRQWQQNALRKKQGREKTRKMLLKIFHREKTSVWNTWLEFVHHRKANKRALLRFSNKIQVKCWFKWRQFHDKVQKLKRVSGRIAARLKLMNAARAVTTWYEFTQEQLDTKQHMRRALTFFSNGTMVRVFSAWTGHTEYMKVFRARTKARMENENLAFAITSWITFTRLRRELHVTVTKLQAFWRGCTTRRRIEDEYLYRIWATVLIQTAWRGRLGHIIMRAATRKARLREYLRAERERDAMDVEEASMRKFNYDIEMIILLQRQWRGVAARTLFVEIRRARYILKKQQEAEVQEVVRAEARKRQLDRLQHEKRRQLAAIEIQRHIRGYLGRKWYRSQQEFLHEQRAASRVQAVYRGRMSRRRTSALRRSYITRMEILARRAVEGKVLRALGTKTRSTQRGLRSFLDFFGLDPATFLTDIRTVFKEVREDFQTMKKFFDVIKTKVHANAEKNAAAAAALPAPDASSTTATDKALRLLQKTDAAKRFLSDFERIVDTTTAEKEKKDQMIMPGMAVRIVLRGHARCGETAFVLSVKEEIAQVKMDVDGYLEFFPLMLPATKVEPKKYVLHRVPELAFTAAYTSTMANGKISELWRQQLEAYATSIAEESKRYCAARVIQCAARVYLSRMRYQLELEAQGVNAARRQKALLRVLKTFHGANTRVANILVQLRFVHALNLPPNLPDEPLEIQKVLNRFQRWLSRRAEIQHAFLRLVPEEFKGNGQLHGQMTPVSYTSVFDKLLHYPIQWLKRATCVPVARQLEKRGLAELAAFISGSEFVKTFEEMHTDAREHCFPQLQSCSFCASEGWALVHGVFLKRKVAIEYPSLQNSSKRKKYATKLVPHGWGVAHFLAGQVGKSRNWLARNSIEAQFKSLQIVKAMKQKEREERLESQILARQGTMNTLRSAEGARGFAKRHAELSVLEENTKAFYQRYVDEIALREKEEAKIFEEEQRVNELTATEKLELERQGIHLNALQQQVPEMVVEIEMVRSSKSALEFLAPGCVVEVEYDDEVWYQCQIVNIDPYDTYMAEIVYVEDQRKEKIKLLEASSMDEKLFQRRGGATMKTKTVAEITAAAAAELEAQEVPFRKWRAGNAVDISWEPPFDNGTPITQYVLEWKDENNEAITGKKEVTGHSANGNDERTPRTVNGHVSTKTTLWPIPEENVSTIRVRIAATNKKGVGLASVYSSLPEELTEVSYRTAIPLTRPPEDTTHLETREMSDMEIEDKASLEHRRRLTCTICQRNLPTEAQVHEHVARAHSVPLLCPFKSCRQVCASEKTLRYHIWRCTIPKPTNEEFQSELFMEIFNISRQYCMRKPKRHVLPAQSALHTEDGTTGKEVYLENKYQDARRAWFEKGKELHEKNLEKDATARRRERENRYDPPRELYGLDFASPELNVARRNVVLNTIQILQTDLDAYIVETNTQMDQLKHEEKELLDYIALKVKRMKTSDEEWQKQSLQREKKKAQKSLDQVQEKISILTVTLTQRIEEMTTEIQRLTTIEKAFVPFTHQVIKMMRLGTLIWQTHAKSNDIFHTHRVILDHFQDELRKLMLRAHHEVEGLEAWDAMIEARRKQLQTLKDELRKLQLMHVAEIQSYRQKRDEGDEAFALRKLRGQQIRIITRQERAAQQLLEKQTRLQAAANALEAQQSPEPASLELTTAIKSLHIVNHDLELHEKFIKGKSEDVEYLKEEPSKAGTSDHMMKGKLLDTVAEEVATMLPQKPATGQATGEQPSLPFVGVADGSGEATTVSPSLAESPRKLVKKTKKHSRMKLQELPHTYTRLECDFQDGFIRGHVRIEYNDGSVYEGPWVEDVSYNKPSDMEPMKTRFSPNHWGKFTSRDGTIWEGEDVDNFFSPFTAMGENFHVTTRENNKYIGAVRAGKYHGFGTLHINFVFSKGEYVGEWCEGKRHGYGIERFDVGEIYEGYWEMDVYHGEGEIVYDDSSRYEGSFRYGKWHGEGVRTLENGDRIVGHFHEGLLNGPGIMEFADKRHYHGSFKNTRRHGLGVLTFPNGERYEGSFENDLPHGEGKYITKSAPGENGNREPLVRMGKWVNGERTAWLSKPSSELATSTFIQYFAVQQNLTGEMEIDLVLPKFKTPYAVMVASMLPNLPEGVNADDAFVKVIMKMLAKTQNIMVGTDILDKTIAEHTQVKYELDNEVEALETLRNEVDAIERTYRAQQRTVNEQQQERDTMAAKELEMQVKVETFWKQKDHAQLENNYKRAVEGLHDVDIMDWFKLRTAKLDAVYLSLLDAFAVLLHFTDNAYLGGKMYTPTKEDLMQLLSSSNENVFLGDKEALIHKYDVKALYVLPLFDVYSFGEGTRNAMLNNLTHVIHHPRLRPNNFRLNQISPAATAVCMWVRAAFFYAKKAVEIYPVMKRVLDQLIIVARLRESLASENVKLEAERQRVEIARQQLIDQAVRVEELRRHEQELQKVIEGIDELDRGEHERIEKQHVKRPQTYRPPSAGINAARLGGIEDKGEQGPLQIAAPQVNHRQVFEEDHDADAKAKHTQRVQKEQVLQQILGTPALAEEFRILKKEVAKVIDRCEGSVPLADFPIQFERIMLKPLDPRTFGVKKLTTLLALMSDTCAVVVPQKEDEVETVQFPVAIDDDDDDDEDEGSGGDGSKGPGGMLPPRLACCCRVCPGVSYATRSELAFHEKTKWHFWNVSAKREGKKPRTWTVAATFWSEAYDSVDGQICYFNKLTGEIVKTSEPPREMQANDVLLELLDDEGEAATTTSTGTTEPAGVYPLDGFLGSDDGVDAAGAGMDASQSASLQQHPWSFAVNTGGDEWMHASTTMQPSSDQNQISNALENAVDHSSMESEVMAADSYWEEVADEAGNVYFYNRLTDQASWTRPM